MNDHKKIAALALAKCAAYDPWFPKASQAIVDSWSEQIARYKLDLADVLAGVTKMYSDNGSGFRPLPKDLTDAAREVRRDRDARTGPTEAYEQLCDSKARPTADELANQKRLSQLIGGVGKSIDHA